DVEQQAANWHLDGTLVALQAGELVGELRVEPSWSGFGELGMMVAADWRGRGVGTALVAAAVEWARARGLHKVTLSVFPHNGAAPVALEERRPRRARDRVGLVLDRLDRDDLVRRATQRLQLREQRRELLRRAHEQRAQLERLARRRLDSVQAEQLGRVLRAVG